MEWSGQGRQENSTVRVQLTSRQYMRQRVQEHDQVLRVSGKHREVFLSGWRRRGLRPRWSCTGQQQQSKEHREQVRCKEQSEMKEGTVSCRHKFAIPQRHKRYTLICINDQDRHFLQ